jgi:hypothetical protein
MRILGGDEGINQAGGGVEAHAVSLPARRDS